MHFFRTTYFRRRRRTLSKTGRLQESLVHFYLHLGCPLGCLPSRKTDQPRTAGASGAARKTDQPRTAGASGAGPGSATGPDRGPTADIS